jgi:hypothetical protein
MLRPQGPLSPRVYWARRLLVVVLVLFVVLMAWWLLGGNSSQAGGTPAPAASGTPSGAAVHRGHARKPTTHSWLRVRAAHTRRASDGPRTGHGGNNATNHGDTVVGHRHGNPSGPVRGSGKSPDASPTTPTRTPLGRPTGDCDPAHVDMRIEVADAVAGRPHTVTFVFTSTRAPACRLAITPRSMSTRVTSGPDNIWSSYECPNSLPAREIVVRRDPPTSYTFTWNGHRSTSGCRVVGAVPKPGGYWVEAALVGGQPHKAYFDIRAPKR